MSAKRASVQTTANLVVVVPPVALGTTELGIVRAALSDVAPDWSVDLHGFCSDEATLILLPEGGDDAIGPSFVISRENFGFRLDQLHWDEMQEVGIYAGLADTVAAIQVCLIRSSHAEVSRITLH